MLTALASIMIIVFLGNKPVQQTTMFAITSPERCGWDLSFPPKGMQPAAALQQPEPAHVGEGRYRFWQVSLASSVIIVFLGSAVQQAGAAATNSRHLS
jgi:hypothetical protein